MRSEKDLEEIQKFLDNESRDDKIKRLKLKRKIGIHDLIIFIFCGPGQWFFVFSGFFVLAQLGLMKGPVIGTFSFLTWYGMCLYLLYLYCKYAESLEKKLREIEPDIMDNDFRNI